MIAQTFRALRERGDIALMPFIPAGFPDLDTTRALLAALPAAGADLIEVGFPFSDPIADGPVIQQAFTEALAAGVTVRQVFDTIASCRVEVPLVAMVSFSIVYRCGIESFAADCKSAGFSGLIIPDLPPPEADSVCAHIHSARLDTALLVAPSTPIERRRQICHLSTAFVYYLSVSGTTGQRESLPADLDENLSGLRSLTDRPICVGFGISKPAHVAQSAGKADGAIVGSAIVQRMAGSRRLGAEGVAAAVAQYCRELKPLVR